MVVLSWSIFSQTSSTVATMLPWHKWQVKFSLVSVYYVSFSPVQVDHIDYIKNKAGIDHVGLGSDFDGISQ